MLLSDYLRRMGGWLFRRRSFNLILAAIPLFLERDRFRYIRGSHKLDLVFELACLLLAMAGLALRAATVGFIAAGTSGRNTKSHKASELNTTGVYSVVRNPLYLGNSLIFLAISLLSQSWAIVSLNMLLFAAIYVPVVLDEEHFLLDKFGDQYRAYADRVPCFIPAPRLWRRPKQAWSWRMVLRREHDTLLAVIIAFQLIELMHDQALLGHLEIDPVWIVITGVALAGWGLLKYLKLRTGLLRNRPAAPHLQG
jgi:protein-S-isoprenylcysteine O-methyltransferase Ste14